MRRVPYLMVLWILLSQTLSAQFDELTVFPFDTVAPGMLRGDIAALLSAGYSERDKTADVVMLTTGRIEYVFPKGTDIKASFYEFFEHDAEGVWSTKFYTVLSASLLKYKRDDSFNTRNFYVQPFLLFQTNSNRGLRFRSQIGALAHPLTLRSKKILFNSGIGITGTLENWRIIREQEIEGLDMAEQEKIRFVADQLPVNEHGNYNLTRLKGVLFLDMSIKFSNKVRMETSFILQQPFKTPYNNTVTDRYKELRKVRPQMLGDISLKVDITRTFSVNAMLRWDYERGGLNLYSSRHETFFLVGLNWRFSKFASL